MQVDYAVELGRDDPVLELPWAAPEGGLRYCDLKRRPELLAAVDEAVRFPELGEFLASVNAPGSRLESAKCDAWCSSEMDPEEDIFAAPWKFGSYVDLVLDGPSKFSFPGHEALVKPLTELLRRAPEIPAQAEFRVRRAFFGAGSDAGEGFYVTLYVFGYGEDEIRARRQWAIALKLVQNAIGQWSRRPPGCF